LKLKSLVATAALACAFGVCACGSSASGSKRVDLVAYSTPQAAYASLIPSFQATPAGRGVTFSQSYGASGDQSRAVAARLPASVVNFSLAPDVDRLVGVGSIAAGWNHTPTDGFVTDSVVVIIVRKGNPRHITGWDDLVKSGVRVLSPNPFSSGAGEWNVLAAYGAQLKEGRTPAQAIAYLTALFHNVSSQDTSAHTALQTFLAGRGDALIDYESEAIAEQKKGAAISYVIPPQTILIQNPIAVTSSDSAVARAFVSYLVSPAAQAIWVANGYRPVIPGVAGGGSFPKPPGLFTIDLLGGWPTVSKQFFDPVTGIMTEIDQGLGVPTSG
jgi:sulfate transport system substrate-binding protein